MMYGTRQALFSAGLGALLGNGLLLLLPDIQESRSTARCAWFPDVAPDR